MPQQRGLAPPSPPDTASEWEARIMQPPEQTISGPPIDPDETDAQREDRRAVQKNVATVTHPDLGLRGTVSTTGPNAYKDFIPLPAALQTLTGGKLPGSTSSAQPSAQPSAQTPPPLPDVNAFMQEQQQQQPQLPDVNEFMREQTTPQWKDLTPVQQKALVAQRQRERAPIPKPSALPPGSYISPRFPQGETSPESGLGSFNPIRNILSYWGKSSQPAPEPTVMSEGAQRWLDAPRALLAGLPHFASTALQASPLGAAYGYLSGDPNMQARAMRELYEGIIAPVKPTAKTAISALPLPQSVKQAAGLPPTGPGGAPGPPLPEDPEWARAQQAAGSYLAGLSIPLGIEAAGAMDVPGTIPQIGQALDKVGAGRLGNLFREEPAERGMGLMRQAAVEPTRTEINNLSSVIAPGVKAGAPQAVAIVAQPYFKEAMGRLGLNPESIALLERAPESDLLGDLYRGTDQATHTRVSQQLAQERGEPGYQAKPLAIEIADKAVEIAHQPITDAIEAVGDRHFPAVKAAIVAGLHSEAADALDPGLANAYTKLANSIEAGDDTARAINDIKVQANKKTGRLFNMLPSQQVAATANPIYAYQMAADLVRENLYPAIQKAGGPDLTEYGRKEAAVIRARDGTYAGWANAAGLQAPAALQTFLSHLRGESPVPPLTKHAAIGRILNAAQGALGTQPLAKFNKIFRDGVGENYGMPPTYTRGFPSEALVHAGWEPAPPPEGFTGEVVGSQGIQPQPGRPVRGQLYSQTLEARQPFIGYPPPAPPPGELVGKVPLRLTTGQPMIPGPGETSIPQVRTPESLLDFQRRTFMPESRIARRQAAGRTEELPSTPYNPPRSGTEYMLRYGSTGMTRADVTAHQEWLRLDTGDRVVALYGMDPEFRKMSKPDRWKFAESFPRPSEPWPGWKPEPAAPPAQGKLPFGEGGMTQEGGASRPGQQRLNFPLKTPREIWLERRLQERFPNTAPSPKPPPK